MLANHVYAHLLHWLEPSVLWLSIVTFDNYVKSPGAEVKFCANLMYQESNPE